MLRRLEDALRHALEAPFANLFPQTVQPLEMAQALGEEMERSRLTTPDAVYSHNRYTLGLSLGEYQELSPIIPALERELASYLREQAEAGGPVIGPHVHVTLSADAELAAGRLRCVSDFLPRPPARLYGLSGTDVKGRWWDLGETQVLGRSTEAGICLPDPAVSRRHAEIAWALVQYEVRDLGSQNGLFVNGQRVLRSPLAPGDLLELGLVQLRVELAG